MKRFFFWPYGGVFDTLKLVGIIIQLLILMSAPYLLGTRSLVVVEAIVIFLGLALVYGVAFFIGTRYVDPVSEVAERAFGDRNDR